MVEPYDYLGKDNVLLLNTCYLPIQYEEDLATGKLKRSRNDYLYLTYRDLTTGQKHIKEIEHPSTYTYTVKEEIYKHFRTQRKFVHIEDLDVHELPYSDIIRYLRNTINNSVDKDLSKVYEQTPKAAYQWRGACYSDFNIEDDAMISFLLKDKGYQENGILSNTNISRAFLDIESDVYGLTSAEMDEGKGPVNAVSVVVPYDKLGRKYDHPKVYTFLLRDHYRYKDQEYLETHMESFLDECHSEFDAKYHEPEFIINFYDSEVDLLRALFAMLHAKSPDFCLIWNSDYDIPKMISRLEFLGEDPTKYFCHPDFTASHIQYNFDRIFANDIKNKSNSFDCTSYTRWLDQMVMYASIRKSYADYGGNNLDNVAHIELKAEKRRYSKKTVSVLNAAIEEYLNFVKYSINDVLLQYGIDEKTGDLDTLFDQSIYGGTRITKTLKQSVYLKNVFTIDYFKMGIVPGNNMNVDYSKNKNDEFAADLELYDSMREANAENEDVDYDDVSLAGALVGDPLLNDACGVKLFGKRSSKYFAWVIDFDYSAEYPSAKITANISSATQYGRIIIPDKILEDEDPTNDPKFMRGGKFILDYETGDNSKIGRWFKLPTSYEVMSDYDDEYHKQKVIETIDGCYRIKSRKGRMTNG